jgi:hypothetical protein
VWTTEAIVRDLVINLIAGLAAGIFIFIVGLYWRRITSYLSRERAAFRRLFGENTWNTGILTVTLDTYKDVRILAQQDQEKIGVQSSNPQTPRFFKIFPDSHVAAFPGAWGDVLGYCSARAAAYLSKGLGIGGITVRVVSDLEVSSDWSGTFVNIGTSASNIKTNDIKHLPENYWLREDLGTFVIKNGDRDREFTMEDRADKGIVVKVDNPYFRGHALFVCAGLGEWGTSGAAYFLSHRWVVLSRRFGKNSFLVVVSVTPGSDMSAREVFALGNECLLWRVRSFLHLTKK